MYKFTSDEAEVPVREDKVKAIKTQKTTELEEHASVSSEAIEFSSTATNPAEMAVLDSSDVMEMGLMRPGPINSTINNNTNLTYSTPDSAPGDHTARPSKFRRAMNMFLGALQTGKPSSVSNPEMRAHEGRPKGYPRLATLIGSDEKFMLYRRFGYLQSRILLHRQDELRELEEDLYNLDVVAAKQNPASLQSRDKCAVLNEEHTALIDTIENKYKAYVPLSGSRSLIFRLAELMITSQNIANLERPQKRDYENVLDYFKKTKPLCKEECYIKVENDIVTLKPGRETTWLDMAVEKLLKKSSCRVTRKVRLDADPKSPKNMRFDQTRVDILVAVIILTMIITLLTVPVYILWYLSRSSSSDSGAIIGSIIGVLTVFTLIFTAVLTLCTRAKRHEVLASAAAYVFLSSDLCRKTLKIGYPDRYCAVLVVFVGNVGQIAT
ncbi:Peptidase C14 caspase domain protein [Rutstroemia sp. NJR-2017a BVV2]|nr:Peptidase C14 caspase domain protein [Rutstroemia sp. NJR-2017a BVV2]